MAQFLDLYRKCFITSGKNPSHGRLSTVGLRAFNPLSLFAAGEPGAWYDPSDLTTLFQDSAGTTPVTAVEQPVGLMKDKSGRGNHAFQATAGNRPLLSARVNLLTYTEQIYPGNGSWTSGAAGSVATLNNAIAPNGALTATRIICDGTAINQGIYANGVSTIGVIQTFGVYLKGLVGGEVIQIGDASSRYNVTLTTNWVFYVNPPHTMLSTNNIIYGQNSTALTFYIWGADLRPTNSGALLPAYQRVNTASDYDTIGFPLYLKANGTSSAMSTNSIDFSGTDKMTVVTGVRKLSDATIGIALELSAIADSNNGTFLLAPSYNGVSAAGAYYSAGAKGTNMARVTSGDTYIAPISNINTFIDSISTPYAELKINGTQVATNTAGQGTGNFGNYPLYLFARAGTSLWFNGQFYGAIIRGAQSDTASVTQTENYMAQKTGITF